MSYYTRNDCESYVIHKNDCIYILKIKNARFLICKSKNRQIEQLVENSTNRLSM